MKKNEKKNDTLNMVKRNVRLSNNETLPIEPKCLLILDLFEE